MSKVLSKVLSNVLSPARLRRGSVVAGVNRKPQARFMENLEGRTLMSTYDFNVTVSGYHAGITAATHDSGTGSLPSTDVVMTASSTPSLEQALQTALTQANVTLTASASGGRVGSYSGTGPSSSNRLLFLAAEDTGKNYPGTTSHEASLATAYGLSGQYVLAFEDGTDWDYNDGFFEVTVTNTTPPAAPALTGATPTPASLFSATPITGSTNSVLA